MVGISKEELCERYNRLLIAHEYELNARLQLVRHMHDSGMKYRDIYAIVERHNLAEVAA